MDSDALNSLIEALRYSPDNLVLRCQVVRELLKARRYQEAGELGQPLIESEHQALGLISRARLMLLEGQPEEAADCYHTAIELDRSLVDEGLEAELEPDNTLKFTTTGDLDGDFEMPLLPSQVPTITFDDIGGMEKLKEQIRLNILYPLQKPEIYEAYGKKIGGGIMLYGPPGCGKTHIARATAGELGASFFTLSLNEILNMYVGETEKNLTHLFDSARARVPAIIFVDEVDALGSKRSSISNASIRWMVSQFLTEMDGISSNNEKLMILGATNSPWNVDSALRRPGRFDRVIFVPPPDAEARAEIMKLHSRKRKVDPSIPWKKLANRTEHFSGADLAHLVELATEQALAEALKSGHLRDVTNRDFERALKGLKPSTMEWLRRARNYVNFANQDGFYDDLSDYLEKARIR